MKSKPSCVVSSSLAALLLAAPAVAGAPVDELCATAVAEARFDLKQLREQEELAPVQRDADQAVFDLLESLWETHSTERLRYLAGRHARDRSLALVDRAAIVRERQEAKLDVLEGECLEPGHDSAAARARYEELSCDLVHEDEEVASLDRDYWQEVIESLEELRSQELVPEQRLIDARYALASARIAQRARRRRGRECRAALAAAAAEAKQEAEEARAADGI